MPSVRECLVKFRTGELKVERKKWSEKNLECGICNRKFLRPYQLTVHFRTHTGEKPIKCDECDFVTHSKDALYSHKKIHRRAKGEEMTTHFCHHCGKTFAAVRAEVKEVEIE